MCIYIYIYIYLKRTSKPPVVLSRLRSDFARNTSLISHSRSNQDDDAKYCLIFPRYDDTSPFKPRYFDSKYYLVCLVYDNTKPFNPRSRY